MKMKKLLKFLLVVCLMTFISVKASGVPNATISRVTEYKDEEGYVTVKKGSNGIYTLTNTYGNIYYNVDSFDAEYCVAAMQRSYTTYDVIGKVSEGWGTINEPICTDYVGEGETSVSFYGDEKDIELRIGFVKKTDWDAFKAENEYGSWSDLEMYNPTSILITGVPYTSTSKAEFVSVLDKDKKVVESPSGYEYTLDPAQKYYARFKRKTDDVTEVSSNYYLNGDYEKRVESTITVSSGFFDVPFTIPADAQDEGSINVGVGNVGEYYEWEESEYLYYELTTKKTADLVIKYKSGEEVEYNYGYKLDAKDYNSSKPLTLNITLKNFKNSEYNATVSFKRNEYDDSTGDYEEIKYYSKSVKLYSGKTNSVVIDSFVPTIDMDEDSEGWDFIEIEADGVKTTYSYHYMDGTIYSAVYDTKGNQVMQGGGFGSSSILYSGNYYKKSPAFENNIYVMYGAMYLDSSKNYTYKIYTIKDGGTKTLLTSGTKTGKEFNENQLFANVKIPSGVTKEFDVRFELYNSSNKLVYVESNTIDYAKKTNIHTYMTETSVDSGAYGYYEYVSTGLDSHNIKILGKGYDESKTYGFLIINEYGAKYAASGTISGKDLNAGKIIKVNDKITDFAYYRVTIFETGDDVIRDVEDSQSNNYGIDYVSKEEYTKITSRKHFENNPTKVLELMKSTSENTVKVVGTSSSSSSGSTTPSTPTTTPTTPTVTTPNLDEFKITSVGTKNVKLSWNKVSEAKGYIVYSSTNNKKWKKLTTTKKNTVLTYNNKKLKTGTKYYYKVVAYKVVKKKNKTIVTSKVLNTTTTPDKPKVKIKTSSYNSATINVGKVKGATKFVIERSTDKKNYTSVGELTKAGNFKDTNVLTGTKYYYRVKACNERCSGYSKVVSVKPSLKKPTLKLVAGKKKVTIKLPGVSGADGYVIVKSTKKNKGFKEVANVDYATKTFDEENLKSKKTYYYKVRAYKLVNGKPVYSAYSKVYKVKVK